MVASTAPQEISSPLEVVDRLFDEGADKVSCDFGERLHFTKALGLDDEDRVALIPSLNDAELVTNLPPFSLVRYRAMVQDTFEPEIYIPLLEERAVGAAADAAPRLVTTKYRECAAEKAGVALSEPQDGRLSSRGVCYCVPLPAETAWAKAASARWAAERAGGSVTTARQDIAAPTTAIKRSRPDDDVDMGDGDIADPGAGKAATDAQRPRMGNSGANTGAVAQLCSANEFGLNFPLQTEERYGRGDSVACLVKTYDQDADVLRLCDIVEVVGVLCVDPEMADFSSSAPLASSGMERDARAPSTALVPRLHALFVRKLPFYHPLMPYSVQWFSEARLADAFQRSFVGPEALASVREAALAHLTCAVAGDQLAAQYLLLLLVSRTFRTHELENLGSWSLGLSSWPAGHPVSALHDALSLVSPRSAHLVLNTETLNSGKWYPKKDDVANRLVAGQLQLAPGTVVLIDETSMSEGQLQPSGVKAITAVGTLVKESSLTCDFMYDVKIPLEVTSIIITAQKRALVKDVSVTLPIRSARSAAAATAAPASTSGLEAVRLFVALVTRLPKPIAVPRETVDKFSDDFSSVRQSLNVAPELCGAWMCVARAYALWHGEDSLAAARWASVFELEKQRLGRCKEDGVLGGA